MDEYPVGLLDEMTAILKDEERRRRRAEAKARANRGRR
jgi:hypothetical protein